LGKLLNPRPEDEAKYTDIDVDNTSENPDEDTKKREKTRRRINE